jgi:hypothetical protein
MLIAARGPTSTTATSSAALTTVPVKSCGSPSIGASTEMPSRIAKVVDASAARRTEMVRMAATGSSLGPIVVTSTISHGEVAR